MAEAKRAAKSKATQGKRTPQGKRTRRPVSRGRKIAARIGIGALVAFIVLGLTGLGTFFYLYATTDLPDPHADFQTNTTFIYYQDGRNQLGSLAVQNRVTLTYDQMPQVMKDAVVAAENRSFWEDPGFSVTGILRSVVSIATGGEVQGGSTITQQYIKILYLDSGQRLSRKVHELILATKMGRELTKEQILEGYLNTIYFGRSAYGIQAASKSFFLKDAKDLTLQEAAALAAILNNPAGFNPSGGKAKLDRLYDRYTYVLGGMLAMGHISQAEHAAAAKSLPTFPEVPVNNRYGGPKGFLIKMVEEELSGLGFSEGEVQGGGLKITTTLHKPMQEAATQTARRYTTEAAAGSDGRSAADLHIAVASVDTATGGILALYGGPDYVGNSRNWATTDRPAASTFKAFATMAGLRNGFSLDSVFNGDTFTPRGDQQPVHNQNDREYGDVNLRKATADSINTAFVDMTEQIDGGPAQVVKAANDAGAPTSRGWDLNNRIALGAAEVSPLNMANSYATLANSGQRNRTHIVLKVESRTGEVLYEAKPANEKTVDQNLAANVTDALRSVVDEGTGRRAQELRRPVAGKTGTNGVADTITSAWFVGYTKQVSTAVMFVAGDSGNADLVPYKRPGDRTFFGSGYPLMTWLDYMAKATEGMEVLDFDQPQDIQAERGETASPSPSPTPTPSPAPTPTPSPSPTETPSPSPTPTPTETATPTPTQTQPTDEPTSTTTTPQATLQPTTAEPTRKPTPTPTPEPTIEPSPTPESTTPQAQASATP